jgi:hypothetical protein
MKVSGRESEPREAFVQALLVWQCCARYRLTHLFLMQASRIVMNARKTAVVAPT